MVFVYLVFLCLWGLCIVVWCKIEERGQESVLSLDLWPKGLNDNSVFMYFTF